MIVEGQRVVYAGDLDPFQEVGSTGKVIAVSGQAAHVQWLDGPKTGSIDLIEHHELLPSRVEAAIEDGFASTLSMAVTSSLSVRSTYDEQGEDGLLTMLDESGHLSMLSEYAEDALLTLTGQIRADSVLSSALASLETDERDSVVGKIASTLLSDRLKES